jgi:hypothetical protein
MKKIQTVELVAKKRKRNQIIMGVVLVFLLVVSTAGFSLMSSEDDEKNFIEEKGFKFFRQNGLWVVEIGSEVFGFQYLPSEVENISSTGIFDIGDYVDKPLYFIGQGDGISEILNVLGSYALRYQEACLENINCEKDLPLKGCEDNIIIFDAGEDAISKEGGCVYLSGDPIRTSDAFLYKIIHIN